MIDHYRLFIGIVAVQLLWFVVVSMVRSGGRHLLRHLLIGLAVGIPFGLIYDLAVGQIGSIFTYADHGFHAPFLFINAAFSYGVAAATVLAFDSVPMETRPRRWVAAGVIPIALLGLILLGLAQQTNLLLIAVLCALVVIASVEIGHGLIRLRGPICLAMQGTDGGFWRVWLFSVMTGCYYEAGNLLIPVWSWGALLPGKTETIILIIAFGYYVLLNPIFLIGAAFRRVTNP